MTGLLAIWAIIASGPPPAAPAAAPDAATAPACVPRRGCKGRAAAGAP
jgi:hypothetical protein